MPRITLATLVAALAALAQAVEFTNSAFEVTAGQPFTIEWADAAGPVTLTLKTGPSDNLQTVQQITSGQTGESFTWDVPTNLPTAQYAFEISDGTGINYSIQFPISGDGTASISGSASGATTAATVTPSSSPASSAATTAPTSSEEESSTSAESETSSEAPSSTGAASSSEVETTTTRGSRTTTSSEASSTTTGSSESIVPDSSAMGRGSAVMGAVIGLGALLLAF